MWRLLRGTACSFAGRIRHGQATTAQSHRWFHSSQSHSNSNFFAWYSQQLDAHPWRTKCLSSGLVAAAGDAICQCLTTTTRNEESTTATGTESSSNVDWDVTRTARFALLGTLWVGPVLHVWYGWLHATLHQHLVRRVLLDQFAFAPIFLSSFLAALWTLEGVEVDGLADKLYSHVPSLVVANWALWIPATAFNFAVVAPKYHVLFSNGVALVWNAYLSYSSHNDNDKDNDRSSTETERQ